MKTSEILRAAKALIDTPEKWWDGQCGKPGGRCVATSFMAVVGSHAPHAAQHAFARAVGLPDDVGSVTNGVYSWNDSHTHADVMAAFDRAIAAEEAKEAHDVRVVFPSEWVEKRAEVPA